MDGHARVLILEDDPDSRALFQEILADSGVQAHAADHDELPEPDGYTLIVSDLPLVHRAYSSTLASDWVQLLRERYVAPVIVVTGHAEAMVDDELWQAASRVIAKPIDVEEFVALVRAADGRPV